MAVQRVIVEQLRRGGTQGGERRLRVVAADRPPMPANEFREGADILSGRPRPVESLDLCLLGPDFSPG